MTKYHAEGDEVWVRGKVVRGGGAGDVTLVSISGYQNKEISEEVFLAVFPESELRGRRWKT